MQTTKSTPLAKWIRILSNGAISIPKAMREKVGIKKGDVVKVTLVGATVIVEPRKAPPKVQELLSAGEADVKADSLLSLVGIIPKGSGLPEDLSVNHDKHATSTQREACPE
jgi:AbrB family looped-hinge helix DNA binding protein